MTPGALILAALMASTSGRSPVLGPPREPAAVSAGVSTSSSGQDLITLSKRDLYRLVDRATTAGERTKLDLRACKAALHEERMAHARDVAELSDIPPRLEPDDGIPPLAWIAISAGLGALAAGTATYLLAH